MNRGFDFRADILLPLTAVLATLLSMPLVAQSADGIARIEVGLDIPQVRIGEVFHSAVRVVAPAGYRIEYGGFVDSDSLAAVPPAQPPTVDDGGPAVYALVAWAAGTSLSASVPITLTAPDGAVRIQQVNLRLPEVLSVLPPPGEEVVPRPPRGLVPLQPPGAAPNWWWLALLVAAILAAALIYWLTRNRNNAAEPPVVDPREWALEQLGDRGAVALLASGELESLFQRVSWVVRVYADRIDPRLGRELTTTEVLIRIVMDDPDASHVRALAPILYAADRVKFARHRPNREEGEWLLAAARDWVTEFPPAEPVDLPRRAA